MLPRRMCGGASMLGQGGCGRIACELPRALVGVAMGAAARWAAQAAVILSILSVYLFCYPF